MKRIERVLSTVALCAAALSVRPLTAQDSPAPTPPPPAAEAPEPDELPTFAGAVEVTASRTEQPVLDAPVAITVVDGKQIETSPARNYGDLLRGVPGLNVIQTSARDITLRSRGATGLAENSQLVLLDGRSIYLDYYGIVVWDYLPVEMDDLASVEVQRGPGSAVWGANALAGVVNLRTKAPRDVKGGLATLGVGEGETRFASVRWADVLGNVSYKVSGGYYEADAFERDERLPDGSPLPFGYHYDNKGTRQPKLDLRVDYEIEPGKLVSAKVGYGGTTGIFHSNVGPFLIKQGAYTGYGEVDYQGNGIDAKVYWNALRGDAPNLLNGLNFSFSSDAFVADVTGRHLFGEKHLLVYGVDARLNDFDLSIAPGTSTRKQVGAFLEDLVTLTDRISVGLGARVDWFDTIGATFSPRTSVVVKTFPNQTARLSYNRAYRAPTLVENYISTPIPNVVFLSNPTDVFFFPSQVSGNRDLDEVSVDAFELGYSAVLGPAVASLSLYQNTRKNNVLFFPTEFYSAQSPPPGWPRSPAEVPPFTLVKTYSYLNVGKIRDRGVELSVDANLGKGLSARASYTWQDVPDVTGDLFGIPLSTFTNVPPRNQWSLLALYDRGPFFGSASVTYTGRAFWADILDARFWGSTDAYTLVNAKVGVRLLDDRIEVAAGATNLLDEKVKQHVYGDIIRRRASVELRVRF
jgi:outer membrane receptor for ferrienterochelin and colicins